MRAEIPIATGIWYHAMSLDITQCHEPTVADRPRRPMASLYGSHPDEVWLARDLGIWSPRTPPVSSVQTALEQNSLMRFVRLAVKAVAALPLVAFIFSLVAPEVTHGIAAAVPPPAL